MKRWMYNALLILFISVFLISGVFLAKYYIESAQQKSKFNNLSSIMDQAVTTPRPTVSNIPDETISTVPAEPELVDVVDPDTGETIWVLPEFAQLYAINNHIVGWITIPGTDIDYPVMQTPDQKDYYLKRDFDRNHSARGCIYAQENCDVFAPSDNIILYGHRMKDRSMFGQLDKYLEKSFYDENPYIYFDTLQQLHTYQIIAVFTTTANQGEGFRYHAMVNAGTAEEFDLFVEGFQEISLYDTGVTAQYGDKLICLSTCEYTHVNGRLVVVAKQIA